MNPELAAHVERINARVAANNRAEDENRARFPEFASFVDHCRALFGNVHVRHVSWPDGSETGRRGPPGVPASMSYEQTAKCEKARRENRS